MATDPGRRHLHTVNPFLDETRANPVPAKARYMLKDLQDWARYCGVRIVFPPSVFPVNSVKGATRGTGRARAR
jgi:hypothetical protein